MNISMRIVYSPDHERCHFPANSAIEASTAGYLVTNTSTARHIIANVTVAAEASGLATASINT